MWVWGGGEYSNLEGWRSIEGNLFVPGDCMWLSVLLSSTASSRHVRKMLHPSHHHMRFSCSRLLEHWHVLQVWQRAFLEGHPVLLLCRKGGVSAVYSHVMRLGGWELELWVDLSAHLWVCSLRVLGALFMSDNPELCLLRCSGKYKHGWSLWQGCAWLVETLVAVSSRL